MRTAMRAIVGLLGVFNAMIGLGFLFRPAQAGASFFLLPIGSQGLATMRADLTGFFIGAAVFALFGAWQARADLLRVPLVILSLALAGRCVSLAADGVGPTAFPPMIAEAAMIAILALAMRTFAAPR